MQKENYGLVLEGGGAKGAYHIGAAKALAELDIKIGGISGTSVGALNGAMLIQDDLEKAYNLWYNIKPSKVYEINDNYFQDLKDLKITKETFIYFYNKVKDIFEKKGVDNSKIKEILQQYIKEDKIRNSGKDFGIVTISLTDKEPMELYLEDIPEGKLAEYLMASAYLPFFIREKVDGKIFLDGGFYNNLPVNLLAKRGYKNIIAVRTFGLGRSPDLSEMDLNIIEIEPSDDLGLTVDFSKKKARRNLNMGYYDTMKKFKDLIGKKYYLDFSYNDEYYFNFLCDICENDILETGKIFKIEKMPPKRLLFEKLIPYIAEMLDIDKKQDYKYIIAGMLEVLAEKLNINRYHIYNLQDLMKKINKNLKKRNSENNKYIPNFVFNNKLLAKTVSDELKFKIILTLLKSKITN
ncbi:MAG TPA: patatin-like phospholipase family protein [Halanaerobiales bacterium]|nr:patatin-like phospholipase family protein [Halanaerobiales bacterium]